MAADILIYDADLVPVGEDQRQHLELTRNIAQRFNNRFGETFVVPEAGIPKLGAKIYDLQDPTSKMSKSADSPRGTVMVFDSPADIERKVKRAVTDPQTNVRYDPEHKPGVSNLLTILAVSTGRPPEELADEYTEYGPLKADTATALVEFLRPVRERYAELAEDPGETAAAPRRGRGGRRSPLQGSGGRRCCWRRRRPPGRRGPRCCSTRPWRDPGPCRRRCRPTPGGRRPRRAGATRMRRRRRPVPAPRRRSRACPAASTLPATAGTAFSARGSPAGRRWRRASSTGWGCA